MHENVTNRNIKKTCNKRITKPKEMKNRIVLPLFHSQNDWNCFFSVEIIELNAKKEK